MKVGFVVILAALALPAVAPAGTVFLLDGRGWGHGVGMRQWGAEGYARHGFGYRQILAHYYPHTTLSAASPRPVRVLLSQGRDAVRIGSAAPFVVADARGGVCRAGAAPSFVGGGGGGGEAPPAGAIGRRRREFPAAEKEAPPAASL